LNGNTRINFTVENVPASYAGNRFMIVFNRYGVLPVKFTSVKALVVQNCKCRMANGEGINIDHYDVEDLLTAPIFVKYCLLRQRSQRCILCNE
jgi:hypothetical protein